MVKRRLGRRRVEERDARLLALRLDRDPSAGAPRGEHRRARRRGRTGDGDQHAGLQHLLPADRGRRPVPLARAEGARRPRARHCAPTGECGLLGREAPREAPRQRAASDACCAAHFLISFIYKKVSKGPRSTFTRSSLSFSNNPSWLEKMLSLVGIFISFFTRIKSYKSFVKSTSFKQ